VDIEKMKVLWQSSGYHTGEKATWTLDSNSARIWPAQQGAKSVRTTSLFTAKKKHVTNAKYVGRPLQPQLARRFTGCIIGRS
jgi:hypothetical protein